jgi:hypothetical protein
MVGQAHRGQLCHNFNRQATFAVVGDGNYEFYHSPAYEEYFST